MKWKSKVIMLPLKISNEKSAWKYVLPDHSTSQVVWEDLPISVWLRWTLGQISCQKFPLLDKKTEKKILKIINIHEQTIKKVTYEQEKDQRKDQDMTI